MGFLKGSGVADSIDALRRSAAAGGSGRSAQLFLKNDSSIKVRFLQEPTTFYEYLEHYDPDRKMFVPAFENDPLDNHPNEVTRKVGKRWICNVLDVETGRVRIVKLNQDQLNRLLIRHARYNTLLDRNYELIRIGGGRDSKFDVDADDPTQMDLSRFSDKVYDLEDWLLGEIDEYHQTNFQAEYRRNNGKVTPPPAPAAPEPPAATMPTQEAIDQALQARKAQEAASKVAELDDKYGATPPWEEGGGPPPPGPAPTGGATPPTPPAPSPGMAEIAAETEAATLQAVPDPEPPAQDEDPWVAAKANGQPCVKDDASGKCVICGFAVEECLMGK